MGVATAAARAIVGAAVAALLAVATAVPVTAAPGDLDGTFDGDGVRSVDLGGRDHAVAALLADGRYLLVGQSVTGDGWVRIAVAALLPDGRLDADFGDGGRVLRAPLTMRRVERAALASDGGIIVLVRDRGARPALVRLLPNGDVDASFGNGGVVRGLRRSSSASALAIGADEPDPGGQRTGDPVHRRWVAGPDLR